MRNVIAIIGSAGKIDNELRLQVEELAMRLADIGFDLVTGGMNGVMRAVARGHSRSDSDSNLIHIEPGWDHPWRLNPFEASIVKTDLGSIRNHFVIRSADLVIAISGGSGTLSEIAIAWQEGKPIATLATSGGWSDRLAGETLDPRRTDEITACDSVEDLVNWADSQRPEGVFTGRHNRGFYPFEVPALHRIQDGNPRGSHKIHARFGMSIEKDELVNRLEQLNEAVRTWDSDAVALVTFDDGWGDVLLVEDEFDRLSNLQPVLFIGQNHFTTPVRTLPMQRLYQYSADTGQVIDDLRTELKTMSEEAAHVKLDEMGVDRMLEPEWLLTINEIEKLSTKGWVIASHGHSHENLRQADDLEEAFSVLTESIEQRVYTPWLAWPEGRWSYETVESAKKGGFTRQFGLLDEPHDGPPTGMVMRKIWS
jgi:uncharacterized protein (TIGR00725 family)